MKRLHRIGIKLMIVGLLLWAIETVLFLIIEGWHYEATSKIEVFFDLLSVWIIRVGFFMWAISAAYVINKIYEDL